MNRMLTKITVAGYNSCQFFQKAANVVSSLEHLYPRRVKAEIVAFRNRDAFKKWLPNIHNQLPASASHTSSPLVWIGEDNFLGGCDDTLEYCRNDVLGTLSGTGPETIVSECLPDDAPEDGFDYDLVVIGGGSGGLSCSKTSSSLGKKVLVLDYVKPSPKGTEWGLGGTCVNVGCIPKKLMHQAALLGEFMHDTPGYGWNLKPESITHSWSDMRQAVNNYIRGLNFGYRVQLREKGVKYENKLGKFVDPHTISCTDRKGNSNNVTARRIVIAVGGRPNELSCPGGELAITSDDLFWLEKSPGKTLVVGASYIALECAGFLHSLGLDTTVMVRSIFLRGFDQDMANRIGDYMQDQGVKFIRGRVPNELQEIEIDGEKKIKVIWEDGDEVYDTVLSAIGRKADLDDLGLEAAGVKVGTKSGKVRTECEQTITVPHIYAIGDVVEGKDELTPVAIQAGKLLANRLFDNSREQMDYVNVTTTVFTPLEYACCGLSEEDATELYGESLEVYHTSFTPLEWFVSEARKDNQCYCKVLVDKSNNMKVIGFHVLCPGAGEVAQGFGVAMKMGLNYHQLESTVGIHPTIAEELTMLTVTKSSGEKAEKSGC